MFRQSKHINFKQLQEQADNLIGRIPAVKNRRKLHKIYQVLKYFGQAALVIFSLLFIILCFQIFNIIKLYEHSVSGKEHLEQAIAFSKRGDFKEAMAEASGAELDFNLSLARASQIKNNYFIKQLPYALSQFNDFERLLISFQFLSKAVYGGANFGHSLSSRLQGDKKISFSKFSLAEKRQILKKIFESAPELNGIKADLALALMNLEQVDASAIPFSLKKKIEQTKKQIFDAEQILAKAIPLSQLLPALAGYPGEAKYLIILQNNDELRPTGGFIGTYGIWQAKDGEIISFATHDIYHLDMPIQNKINVAPPEPIKKYLNDKWYLRDANWSPDWPTAANKINWFYQTESNLNSEAEKISEFGGVIAMTPKLITDFLKIIGPVTIEGVSYDQYNFQKLLQYRVERGYVRLGVSSWQRKEVIGEIAKEIKIKIFDLPSDKWKKIINIFNDNLTAKNLIFYFNDNQLESLALENGWAGELKRFYGDYLMVVDANLAALKTDAVMNRGLDYKVSQGVNGWFARLILNYSHNGKPDWKTSAYKSYTRVFVPLGSQLIGISGYAPDQINTGDETGKTWFGFYLTVEPGKIKNLTIEYKLPSSIIAGDNYEFYLQKQPGKEINQAIVDFNFLNDIKSYSPTTLYMQKTGPTGIRWEGELDIDRDFEVKF